MRQYFQRDVVLNAFEYTYSLMENRIDFVITWVDGNDPKWRKERDYYAGIEYGEEVHNQSRYRDWDTLRYWFRGIEKFAPWVNKIFFVTLGHLPKWLNTNNSKLQIVKHSEFIPTEYLPTFNSNVIEFYLHKIKGLSEQFVYFNDDFFLIDHVTPARFFKNGLPCDIGGMTFNLHSGMFGTTVLLAKTLVNNHFNKKKVILESPFKWFNICYIRQSVLNLICFLIRRDEFVGFVNPHLPQPFLKQTFVDTWTDCEKDLIRTSQNKFRKYGDVAFWLMRYWQLASNRFSSINPYKDGQYYLVNDNNVSEIVNCIRRQKKKMICLNDSEEISDFEETRNIIIDAFGKILPNKSSFER